MSSRLPLAQLVAFSTLFPLCATCMALAAAAHVYESEDGPPHHVMHFQCATLSFVVVQQAYYIAHFITRMRKPTASFLGTKYDIGFLVFFVAFGMPVTFALTSKISEFRQPWKTGPVPLQWQLVIADTAFAWVILIVLWAWLITEFTVLYKRFGPRIMWRVSLATLNQERARSDAELMDNKSTATISDSSHSGFNH